MYENKLKELHAAESPQPRLIRSALTIRGEHDALVTRLITEAMVRVGVKHGLIRLELVKVPT